MLSSDSLWGWAFCTYASNFFFTSNCEASFRERKGRKNLLLLWFWDDSRPVLLFIINRYTSNKCCLLVCWSNRGTAIKHSIPWGEILALPCSDSSETGCTVALSGAQKVNCIWAQCPFLMPKHESCAVLCKSFNNWRKPLLSGWGQCVLQGPPSFPSSLGIPL